MDQQPMVDNDDGVDFDASGDIDPNQEAKAVHEISSVGTASESVTDSEAIKDDLGEDVKSIETHGDETETKTAKVKEADDAQSEIVPEGQLNMNHHRYDKVVIVTKIQKPQDINILKKMFCFCNGAYNRYVNYDVVVFIAEPFTQKDVEELREITALIAPAKLTVASDGPSLEEHLATMTEEEIKFLYDRCNVTSGENITWRHHCTEPGNPVINNLAYAWQSEFRTYHIYKHPALAEYKYMIWFDSDAQCIEPWEKDPMKVMVENDLVLLYHHFPNGRSRSEAIRKKTKQVYNREVCSIVHKDHHLEALNCSRELYHVALRQVHGFHHITNLDFYRNETQQQFLKLFVSDYKFSRTFDDQIGVTLPAALGAPTRTSGYEDHGLNQRIFHKGRPYFNGRLSRYKRIMGKNFTDLPIYWYTRGGSKLMRGGEKCTKYVEKPKDK